MPAFSKVRVPLKPASLAIGNVVFHVEAILVGTAAWGTRIGIAAAVVLIALVFSVGNAIARYHGTEAQLQALAQVMGENSRAALAFGDRESAQTSLAALRDELIARGGAHAEALARGRAVRVSLNQTMADETAALSEGAEVAFFPPVTGG